MRLPSFAMTSLLMAFFCLGACDQSEDKIEQKPEVNSSTISEDENLDWIVDELQIKWNNNKNYCIETLESMPEEAYNFIPADSIKSFSEQASHIITTMHWQMAKLGFDNPPEFNNESKAELIKSYELLFDYLLSELEAMDGEALKETVGVFYGKSTKRRLFNLLDHHVAHHRGQMIVYLRLKGIEPPKYRGW